MNQINPANLPPENSLNPENNPEQNEAQTTQNQEPELDLNLLDARLTELPKAEKVNQILDNAINQETSDTLESGLFLHVAENMLEALFKVDRKVFTSEIAQQAEIRKRLQLLISKLSGSQTSIEDIQGLKLKLAEVLFSHNEIQVPELKDFAKKFKLKFNQLINNLVLSHDFSMEQLSALDSYRERFKEQGGIDFNLMRDFLKDEKIDLKTYFVITGDQSVLGLYPELKEPFQVTKEFYQRFQVSPNFCKYSQENSSTNKMEYFIIPSSYQGEKLNNESIQNNDNLIINPINFNLKNILELSLTRLEVLKINIPNLEIPNFTENLAQIFNNNPKLEKIIIGNKEYNLQELDLSHFDQEEFLDFFTSLDPERLVDSKENSELKSKDIHPNKLLELYLNQKIQNFYMDEAKFGFNIHGQMLEIFSQAESINISQLDSDALLIFFELPSLKSISLKADQFSKLSESEWFISENVNLYDFKVTNPENLTYEILKKYQKESVKSIEFDFQSEEYASQHEIKEFNILNTLASLIPQNYSLERPASKIKIKSVSLSEITPENQKVLSLMQIEHLNIIKDPEKTLEQQIQEILKIPNMHCENLFLQGFKLSTDGGEITPEDIFNLSKKFPKVKEILLLESIQTPAKSPIQEFWDTGFKSDEELKENFLGYERKTLSAKELEKSLKHSQIKNLLDFNLPISFANIQFINGVPQLKLEDLKIPNLVQDIAKFNIPEIVIHAQHSSQRSAIIERFFDQEFNLPNHINEIQVYYAKEKDIVTNYSKADLIINQIVNLDNLADIQKLILNNLEDFKQRASSFALPPELKVPQGFKVAPQLTQYFLDLSSYHITNTFKDIQFQLTSDNLDDFQNLPSPRLNFYLHSSFSFNEYTVAKIFENNPKTNEIKIENVIYDRKSENDLNLQNLLDKPDSKLETIYDTIVSLKVSDKNINQFLNLKFKNLENLELNGFEDLSQDNQDKLLNFLAFSLPVSIQRVVVHKLSTTYISKEYGEGFFAKIILNNPNLKYFASQEISKIVENVLIKATFNDEDQQQAYRFIRLFQQANKKIPYPSKSVFKEFDYLEFTDRNHASIFYQFLEQLDSPIYVPQGVIDSLNDCLGFSSANALPIPKVEKFEIPKRLEISYQDFINKNFLINKKEDIDTIYNNTHIIITDDTIERIYLNGVKNISFPNLTSCGSINLKNLENLAFPSLESCEKVNINNVENLAFPSLKSCEKVNINNVENLALQNLKFAKEISLNNCSNVNLQSLKQASEISISNSKEVDLYNLSTVGILNISNLRNLETPSLKNLTSANLKNVNTFSAQILSNFAREIIAPDTTTINLPRLLKAEFLDFSEASTLNLNTNIEILNSIIVKTQELKDKLKTSENIKDYQIQVAVRKLTPIEILPEGDFEGSILEYISSPANFENVTITDQKLDDGILNMMFANFKGTLNLPNLESYTGSILIHSAKELNLPNLKYLKGSLEFNGGTLHLPALQLAQKLNIKNIETFNAPSLLSILDLTTINVKNIEVPHLLNAENISCIGILNEVNSFNAPNLFNAIYINLDAKNINLNSLISVQGIKAKNCEDLNLPSLKYIDSINDSLNYTDILRLAGTQKYAELTDEEYYSIRDNLLDEYRVNPQDFNNTMNTETLPQNPSPAPIFESWDEMRIEFKMLQEREERKKYEEYLSFEEDLSFEDQLDFTPLIISNGLSFSRQILDAVKPQQIKIESSNFTFSRISNSDFQNIVFVNSDLRGASIKNSQFNQVNFNSCNLSSAKFEKTNLQGTKFRNTKLEYISFKNCNLSRAVFGNASLEGANFEGSNLSGVDLSECNLSEARLVDLTGEPEKLPVGYRTVSRTAQNQNGSTITLYTVVGPKLNLKGANLSESNLEGLDLSAVDLTDADLIDANLKDANLKDAKLKGADLIRANLQGANLENVQLINTEILGARLVDLKKPPNNLPENFKSIQVNLGGENVAYTIVGSLDLQEAFLEGADLSNLYLPSAIMQETFLLNANLSNSDLENADLRRANLQGSNLQNAILENADLTGANLKGANLSNANLQNAKLINLKGVPEHGNLPDGYEIKANENGTFDIQLIPVEPELPPIESEENPNDELSIDELVFNFQGELDQTDQDLEPAQPANSTEKPSQAEDQVEPAAEPLTPEPSLEAVQTLEPAENINQNIDLELPSQNIHQVSESDILNEEPLEEPLEQAQEPLKATIDKTQMSFTDLRIQRLQEWRDRQNNDQAEKQKKNQEHWQRLSNLLQNSALTADKKQEIQTQIQESCQKSLVRQLFRIGWDEKQKITEIRSSEIHKLIKQSPPQAFQDADFSGLDLSYHYFFEKIFNNANLQGTNLQGAHLEGSLMIQVNFENANLSNANLMDTDLSNTNFKKANLQGANLLNANLSGADLSEAKLDGAVFTNVIINDKTKLPNGYKIVNNQIFSKKLSLTNYNFQGADLTSFDLRGAYLYRADLRGANLQGANLKGANLSNADLSETDLSSVELTKEDMIGIRLVDLINPPKKIPNGYKVIQRQKNGQTTYTVVGPNVNLMYADLSNAQLNRTNLSRSNLNGADLSGSYFYNADLTNANLSGTDLSGSHLSEANLTEANLKNADLSGAHLGESILTETDLSGAILNGTFVANTDFSQSTLHGAILNQVYISIEDQSTLKLPEGWILEQHSNDVSATIRMLDSY